MMLHPVTATPGGVNRSHQRFTRKCFTTKFMARADPMGRLDAAPPQPPLGPRPPPARRPMAKHSGRNHPQPRSRGPPAQAGPPPFRSAPPRKAGSPDRPMSMKKPNQEASPMPRIKITTRIHDKDKACRQKAAPKHFGTKPRSRPRIIPAKHHAVSGGRPRPPQPQAALSRRGLPTFRLRRSD